jgi:hypothetical protein
MPRFAVLAHDHPTPHWDLFLEAGDVLRSWRLSPGIESGEAVPAEPTADHRLTYLDYEGPVSGGRGTVARVDAGTFDWLADLPHSVQIRLTGRRLFGIITLTRIADAWTARLRRG